MPTKDDDARSAKMRAEYPRNHCKTCGRFWPVENLARSCEAKHEDREAEQ